MGQSSQSFFNKFLPPYPSVVPDRPGADLALFGSRRAACIEVSQTRSEASKKSPVDPSIL